MEALERALLDPSATGAVPVAVPRLRQQIAVARSVFQHGRYADVAGRLPDLLSSAMATRADCATSEQIVNANGLLAELHTLTSELMVKFGNDQLAWTTADRAMQAAHGANDLLTRAGARRAWAIVLRRTGHTETAQRLVVDTATALQADLHRGPEYLSVYGSLLSTAAYTAAVDGDRATARSLIGEAVDAAARLGTDGNHRFTAFGPTGVDLYGSASPASSATTALPSKRHNVSIRPASHSWNAAPATGATSPAPTTSGTGPTSATAHYSPPNTRLRTRSATASRSNTSPPACFGIPPHTRCPACAPSQPATAPSCSRTRPHNVGRHTALSRRQIVWGGPSSPSAQFNVQIAVQVRASSPDVSIRSVRRL